MKRPLAPLALALLLGATGCYGSYSAFNTLHKWNGTATSSKVGNSFIHFALWIIPAYELFLFGDLFIFNTVEFFSGEPVFK
jgi:hypothetical protein